MDIIQDSKWRHWNGAVMMGKMWMYFPDNFCLYYANKRSKWGEKKSKRT